jgi:hypothetical protein
MYHALMDRVKELLRTWWRMYSSSSTDVPPRPLEWFTSVTIVGLTLVLIARTIWLMDRGFDFTDQSFYLMWAQRPASFAIAYGLFGHGLHPLFELFNGSVANFQRAAAAILVIIGASAGSTVLDSLKIDRWGPTGLQIVAVSAALPFAYYIYWLVTPSYNWFALVGGLLLIGATIDLHSSQHGFRSAAAAAFAALFVIFARPQNVIAYACIYMLAIAVVVPTLRGKLLQTLRVVYLTAIFFGFLIALSPIHTIVDQVQAYIAIFGTDLPTERSLLSLQFEFFRDEGALLAFSAMLFLGSLTTLHLQTSQKLRMPLILLGAAATTIVNCNHFNMGAVVFCIGPAAGVFAFTVLSLACLSRDADFRLLVLMGLAALVPWAATFGTNNRILVQLDFYVGLWSFVALVAASSSFGKKSIVTTIATFMATFTCLAFTVSVIQLGLDAPYRLATPVEMQVDSTTLGWGSKLKLDPKTSTFIQALQESAKQQGFCRGDPVIDLSGSMPGVVFAVGGWAPAFPWLFAGYPFSDHFAREVLKRVDRVLLSRSWLIVSDLPGAFSLVELRSFGIDLSAYRLVADLNDPIYDKSVRLFAPQTLGNSC